MDLSLLFPEISLWTLTLHCLWVFFFLLVSCSEGCSLVRWHQTFSSHSLPVPHARPGSLGEGSIHPDGAMLLRGTKRAARMHKLWQPPSTTLILLVLLHYLKPWEDHFSTAEIYGLICDIYSNLFCHFRCLSHWLQERHGRGVPQDAADSVHGGGHKAHELGVRERPVARYSTGTIIKVQPPASKTKIFWDGWTGHHFIYQQAPMRKEGRGCYDTLSARTDLSFFGSEEHLSSF